MTRREREKMGGRKQRCACFARELRIRPNSLDTTTPQAPKRPSTPTEAPTASITSITQGHESSKQRRLSIDSGSVGSSNAHSGSLTISLSSTRQWSFIKKICSWGVASFLASVACCRLLLDSADSTIVRKTFYAGIPRILYSLPVAAFGCALFLNISSWKFETHRSRQQLCVLVIYISGVAFAYELLALYSEAPIFLTQGGRPHSVLRYVMWAHATPVMVYALSMLSDLSTKRVHTAMLADVVMILAAIPGEYCSSWLVRYFFNTLSFFLFPFVLKEIYTMFTQAMDATAPNDRQAYTSLKFLRGFTLVLWSVFPVVWTLCQLDMIDSVMEEGLHSMADVFGKVGCCCRCCRCWTTRARLDATLSLTFRSPFAHSQKIST